MGATARSPVRLEVLGVWLGGVVLAVVLGFLASTARSWAAPVAIVAVLILAAYYMRVLGVQVGLVVLLIVTSVVDHFTFPLGSVAVRAEQIAALVALTALTVIRIRQRDTSWLRPSLSEWLLLAWFATSAVSSLLASPDGRLSAKILILVAVCSLGFFLPRRLLAGQMGTKWLETVILWLLVAFASESAYGTITYLLHAFGPTISIGPNPASGHLASYGTLWEQNVLGAFAAAGGVAWTYLGPSRFKHAWLGLAACLGGVIDSLTRAAWLAAAIAGALGVTLPGLRRRLIWHVIGLGALGGLAVAAATAVADRVAPYTVLVPGAGGGRSSLLTALLNLVDIVGRLNQFEPVRADISGHLLLGRGTASFEVLHVVGGVPEHIASLPLLVFNDTGLIGLVLFVGFAVAVFAGVWPLRGRHEIVLAMGQVALVIVLANLATETTELMIDWLLIGILVAAADLTREDSSTDGKAVGSAAPWLRSD